MDDPIIEHIINTAKINPKYFEIESAEEDVPLEWAACPLLSLAFVCKAGVHMKMKVYMDPSKSD